MGMWNANPKNQYLWQFEQRIRTVPGRTVSLLILPQNTQDHLITPLNCARGINLGTFMIKNNITGRVRLVQGFPCLKCDPTRTIGDDGAWGVLKGADGEFRDIFVAGGCPQHFPQRFAGIKGQWAHFDWSHTPAYEVPVSKLRQFGEDPFVSFVREVLEAEHAV